MPLIDAHNDLPYNIRKFVHNQLAEFNFDADLKNVPPWSNSNWSHTDLQRLKKGQVAAQVSTVYSLSNQFFDCLLYCYSRYSRYYRCCCESNTLLTVDSVQQMRL